MVTDPKTTGTGIVENIEQLQQSILIHLRSQMDTRDKLDIKVTKGKVKPFQGRVTVPIIINLTDLTGQFHHYTMREKVQQIIAEICHKRLPGHCTWHIYWFNGYNRHDNRHTAFK